MASALRQQPGLACESCRKKKSRCDRGRPVCGNCAAAGAVCVFTDKRPQRGPRKGQLQALRTRVATLERCLVDQPPIRSESTNTFDIASSPETPGTRRLSVEGHGYLDPAGSSDLLSPIDSGVTFDTDENTKLDGWLTRKLDDLDHAIYSNLLSTTDNEILPPMGENPEANQLSDEESAVGSDLNFTSSPTTITTASSARSVRLGWNDYRAPKEASRHMRHMALGDCVQADLDQLYFDRVHPIAPLMHRARYFSWAHQPDQPEARAALQSAMRTLAAAASSPFQQLSNSLYAETRQMLERLDDAAEQQSTGNISLEHIQAWLLLAHYEFMRMPHRRAMMTAGRVFRMVQVALLHDVYEPDMALGDFGADPNTSWVEMEEKRRTFWVAYCLDRCIGLHERCPLTFHEDGLRTRLPAPDADFERSRPMHTDFLPEAIAASGQTMLSPFAECVVFLTLWGRCILVRQPRPLAEHMYSNDSLELWARYEWLDNVLEKRRSRLAQSSPIGAVLADPMLVFTFMVADIIKIHLMNSLQSKSASTVLPHQVLAEAHGERAAEAAREIALLAKTVSQLSCFKTHPFLPSALFQGARTLLTNMSMGPAAADARGVAELLDTLRNLKGVNNLAQELLRRIEFDGLPESTSTSRLQPGWNSNDGTCMSFGPLS